MNTFDPALPFNLPSLPPKFDFDDPDILKAVARSSRALAELKGKCNEIPNVKLLLHPLLIREALQSSEIENIHTTAESVFQAELFPEKRRGKPEKEVLHYREALLRGYDIVQEKGFLNTNGIIEIQKVLEPSKSGIRKIKVMISDTAKGEVLYTPPTGEAILRELLKNLEGYLNERGKDPDPLVRMAILHYQFEAIHPFLDGNGRTGRMLMVLYLVLQGLLEYPILFISEFINARRNDYYQGLREVTKDQNWKAWTLFVLEGIEEQSAKTSQRIANIRRLKEDIRTNMKAQHPKLYNHDLIEHFFNQPFVHQDSLARSLRITRQTAGKQLKRLQEAQYIDMSQQGRMKLYFIHDFLHTLA